MTQDKILDKLSKLRASAEGEAKLGNAEAAEAFASMINSMLLKHELSMEDVPMGGVVKDEPIVELMVDLKAHGVKDVGSRIGWQEALARIVADAHLCRFLVTTGTNWITFVGTKEHATVAAYAYGVLCSAADRMSMAARAEWWKRECGGKHLASGNFRAGWIHGFVGRIAERFAAARKAEVKATGNESQALVRLSGALARAAAHVAENYKKKAPSTSMKGGNREGYREGRAAADSMKIGQRGIGNSAQRALKEQS